MVSPEVYDDDYYRSCCAGHEAWTASGGAAADGMYAGFLVRAGLRPGEVLVDLGCGRGELLAEAVARGAARAVGVEYAASAVALARQTLAARDVTDRATVVAADVRAVPLPDASADLVTLLDVVEHLAPQEVAAALAEARRLLRPGGRVLVHTMPNRAIYSVTYPVLRAVLGRGRWPADPRNDWERLMHVNEQTPAGLRRALTAAGFRDVHASVGDWVYADFVPPGAGRRAYSALAKVPGVRRWAVANVWGEGRA